MVDKIPNDLEGMEASMERLLVLIGDIHRYVDDVVVRLILLFLFTIAAAIHFIGH